MVFDEGEVEEFEYYGFYVNSEYGEEEEIVVIREEEEVDFEYEEEFEWEYVKMMVESFGDVCKFECKF